jgi:hypothetical protein
MTTYSRRTHRVFMPSLCPSKKTSRSRRNADRVLAPNADEIQTFLSIKKAVKLRPFWSYLRMKSCLTILTTFMKKLK